ncbi:hypothetical protein SAMN05444172_8383 [Burkholderia sp. GAS332]|nr:hypothetical protein SAMN05444172_8383 [Burkholderia sp. GAS332]
MFLWLPLLTNRAGTKSLFFDAALVMNGRNRVFRVCAEVLVQLFARTKGLYSFCLHMCNANVCDIAESFNPRAILTFDHSGSLHGASRFRSGSGRFKIGR